MGQKCVLIIADGLGCGEENEHNAFYKAKTPTYDALFKTLPHTLLEASGEAVGLPAGQMGNSEVGHLCIGAGRVIYQNLTLIDKMIREQKMQENINLASFLQKHKRIHIAGLYSNGGVHSMDTHFKEIIRLARKSKCEVCVHMISDGRDVGPRSAKAFLQDLQEYCKSVGAKLCSLSGRFYAMDRDNRWERVRVYYDALMGKAPIEKDFVSYIDESLKKGITDEFISPVISPSFDKIKEDDGLILINFRNDRMIELVRALKEDDFTHFPRKMRFCNILTMSIYDESFNLPSIIPKQSIPNTLSEVISRANLRQLHTAETEKFAHVTFFFNAQKKEALAGEKRVLIPSPKVKSYDLYPKMSAKEVACEVIKGIEEGIDFIVVNFANCDMVGHTGNMQACVQAVNALDLQLGRVIKAANEHGYAFILSADHGNCELMADENGVLPCHTTNKVYAFIQAKGVNKLKQNCSITGIAPSVLRIMGLCKPSQMDEDLIKE